MADLEHPDSRFANAVPASDPVPYAPPKGSGNRDLAGPQVGRVNPRNDVDIERLRESMQWSAVQFTHHIEAHQEVTRFYAGNRYTAHKMEGNRTPVNMLKLACDIWSRQLVTQSPRTIVLTKFPPLRADAYELELATNHLLKATLFGATLEEVVQNALFGLGVMKVGITSKYMSDAFGYSAAAGQPYASSVLVEDWLHDMNARRKEEFDWCGNRYRVPLDVVLENPEYDQQAKDLLDRLASSQHSEELGGNPEKASDLSADRQIEKTEYHKHVELWDIWLPMDKLLVTMPVANGTKPLQIREWEGPEHGPYHLLQFGKVPGNLMPSAPAQSLYDLQDQVTKLFNQLAQQALRQKTVTIVDGKAEQDGTAAAIQEAEDGEIVRTNHIESVKEMEYGGVHPDNLQFFIFVKDLFSYMGGNLDAMGGLAQQAETLGQEKMLIESSSEMLRDMQSRVIDFTEMGISDLSWYMYTDPTIELPLTKPIEEFGDIPFTYGPENRKSDFFMYAFEVQPYSLQSKSPGERLQAIMQIATTILIPLAPQMAEWGMNLDLKRFVELIGKYSDMPEIAELISSMMPLESESVPPPSQGQRSGGTRPLQSPVTQRNYTRTNVSAGGTQKSRDMQLMQSLISQSQKKG